MKILMIAPEPFFEPRGTPISVYQRLTALSALGHQVDLITYHVGEDVDIDNMTIHRIPTVPFVKSVKVGPSFVKLWLDVLLLLTSVTAMVRNRYDVIHTHEEGAFLGILLGKLFRTPHVYDMHSSLPRQLENFQFGWRPLVWVFELLERWVLTTSERVITVGEDLEEIVRQISPRAKVSTIENMPFFSEDLESITAEAETLRRSLSIEPAQPTIVYTGTFEAYQGLDLLMESAASLSKTNPEARFVLVGGKPEQVAYWRVTAQKRGLEDFVRFTGVVSPREAACYMSLASILVSTRTEGTSVPLKIYSYLSANRPIVATRIPAHTQVLNDEVALLVEPSSEALAEGIRELMSNEVLRERLSQNAKALADENHNTSWYLTRLRHVYPPPASARLESEISVEQLL